jgi:glycosyltransferase involved in cell wall biosynthesis
MENPIKVVHMSSVHPWNDVRIMVKECRSLARAGFNVTFVVPAESALEVEGVKVCPVGQRTGRIARMTLTVLEVLRTAANEKADIYHFHDPELIPVGLVLKALQPSCRVVYDTHEDMPRSILSKHWIPDIIRMPASFGLRIIERISTTILDGVVAATPSIAKNYDARKTVTVQNFPVLSEYELISVSPEPQGEPYLIHTGRISEGRGAKEMVHAMGLMSRCDAPKLVLAGMFVPTNYEDVLKVEPGWDRISFVGWKSRTEMNELLRAARAGLTLLHPEPNYIEAQPNKLFEYMAAGIPVIASDFPRWREIIGGANCGLLVDPLDPSSIASAIEWLLEHPNEANAMGDRGRRAVLEAFNWEREAKELLSFYDRQLVHRRFRRSHSMNLEDSPSVN